MVPLCLHQSGSPSIHGNTAVIRLAMYQTPSQSACPAQSSNTFLFLHLGRGPSSRVCHSDYRFVVGKQAAEQRGLK